MCFLNKFKKKSVYVRIAFRFNKINIDVLFEHLKTSFAFEKTFFDNYHKSEDDIKQNEDRNDREKKKS